MKLGAFRTRAEQFGAWIALAAAMGDKPGHVLAYEPVYEWINGMGVVLYDGDSAPAGAGAQA